MADQREELELRRKTEIHEVEEVSGHTQIMTEMHETMSTDFTYLPVFT